MRSQKYRAHSNNVLDHVSGPAMRPELYGSTGAAVAGDSVADFEFFCDVSRW